MRRAVQDRTGATVGTIGDVYAIGDVAPTAIDDRVDRFDNRPIQERTGTISIHLPLLHAIGLAGKKVVIYIIEE